MQNIRRPIFKTKQLPMNQNRCFPNNTVAWLRQKSQEDPNYLLRLLSSENYNNFVRRYEMQGQFDQIESNEEKNAEIAENIWKDMVMLRQKSQEDPNYLLRLLSSENYNNFVRRYEMQGQFDQIESNEEKNAEIAENIWKDMVMLINRSTDNQTKQFSTIMINHLRNSWKKEKEEFMRNNPNL